MQIGSCWSYDNKKIGFKDFSRLHSLQLPSASQELRPQCPWTSQPWTQHDEGNKNMCFEFEACIYKTQIHKVQKIPEESFKRSSAGKLKKKENGLVARAANA